MALAWKNELQEAEKIVYIPMDEISVNHKNRRHYDREKLRELSESIKMYGVLQPVSVRKKEDGFELVAGERRLKAAKMAGLYEIPCVVMDVDTYQSAVLKIVENVPRENLDYIEEAECIYQMIQVYGLTIEEAALKLGKTKAAVEDKLKILDLPGELLFVLRENGLNEKYAKQLIRVEDDSDKIRVLEQIIQRNLNISATEKLIDKFIANKNGTDLTFSAPVYVIKDVRVFLNCVKDGIETMGKAGVYAQCVQNETDDDITLTIKIPKCVAYADELSNAGT